MATPEHYRGHGRQRIEDGGNLLAMRREDAIEGWHRVELATSDLGIELRKTPPSMEAIEDCLARGAMVDRVLGEHDLLGKRTWQDQVVKSDLPGAMTLMIQAHPSRETIFKETFAAIQDASPLMVQAAVDALQPFSNKEDLYSYLFSAICNDNLALAKRLIHEGAPLVAPNNEQTRLGFAIGSVAMFELLEDQGYPWEPGDLIASAVEAKECLMEHQCPKPDLFRRMATHPRLTIHHSEFAEKAWNALLGERYELSTILQDRTLEIANELVGRGINPSLTDNVDLLGVWTLSQIGMPVHEAIEFIERKDTVSFLDSLSGLVSLHPQRDIDYFETGQRIVLDLIALGLSFKVMTEAVNPKGRWAGIFWSVGCPEQLLPGREEYKHFISEETTSFREQTLLNQSTLPIEQNTQDQRRL